MTIAKDKLSKNAMGGTELMKHALVKHVGEEALKEFQIFVSRVEEPLDENKIRVFWAHDLPGDPASDHLKDGGWNKFHKLVFVSNWQMQGYISRYGIPWSKCIVLQNAIEPIDLEPWYHSNPVVRTKWDNTDVIKLIYTPTPHRGLEILVPVFQKLCETYSNLHLDVYSSFKIYGWGDRDKDFENLYEICRDHPHITYHGSVSNDLVRKALLSSHIFAYPSIWPETSCLSLIEAMSAGNVCVHSNYAALPETAANWTHMYHYHEEKHEHANIFYSVLASAIEDIKHNPLQIMSRLTTQKNYVDIFYSWHNRTEQWKMLFQMLLTTVTDRSVPKSTGPMFVLNTGA